MTHWRSKRKKVIVLSYFLWNCVFIRYSVQEWICVKKKKKQATLKRHEIKLLGYFSLIYHRCIYCTYIALYLQITGLTKFCWVYKTDMLPPLFATSQMSSLFLATLPSMISIIYAAVGRPSKLLSPTNFYMRKIEQSK